MKQINMFKNELDIPGLLYLSEYITIEQEEKLIKIIDKQEWIVEFKRRVQHYGYKYDYRSRSIDSTYYLGALPKWLLNICKKLYGEKIFNNQPNQIIINEYLPGQGIAAHTDCITCFDNTICSLSLGAQCVMDLTNNSSKQILLLEPRSLLILQNDARYLWKHGIAARKNDRYFGVNTSRSRRISLTFRKII